MRKRQNRKGFVLIVVVFFISIIGVEMTILTGVSNTMAFETNNAYLDACRENLVISGLAWARENADKLTTNEVTELDITSLAVRRADLKVLSDVSETGQHAVTITASCSAARQTLKASSTYDF